MLNKGAVWTCYTIQSIFMLCFVCLVATIVVNANIGANNNTLIVIFFCVFIYFFTDYNNLNLTLHLFIFFKFVPYLISFMH